MTPCILHEDEHLLVVHKPAGVNTHRPSPHTTDGIYDWLRRSEERWTDLSTLHRLDKETSGVLCFGKTRLANKSLSEQFAKRQIKKTYLLLTDWQIPFRTPESAEPHPAAGESLPCSECSYFSGEE